LKIDRKAFASALSLVSAAVPARTTIKALSHVLIEPEEDAVRLTTTDIDTTMSARVAASAPIRRPALAPFVSIISLVRLLESETVEIEVDSSNRMTLSATGHRSKIPCLPSEEFPHARDEERDKVAEIPSGHFLSVLRSGGFSAYKDRTPEAVRIYFIGSRLYVASTTGSNAARASVEIGRDAGKRSAIVGLGAPPKLEAFATSTDTLRLSVGKSSLRIEEPGGNWIVERLLDVAFPENLDAFFDNYHNNPDALSGFHVVSREVLISAMKRLTAIRGDGAAWNDLDVKFSGSGVTMTLGNPDVGIVTETVESEDVYGTPRNCTLYAPMIVDGIKHARGGLVRIGVSKEETPLAVISNHDEALRDGWMYLSAGVLPRPASGPR